MPEKKSGCEQKSLEKMCAKRASPRWEIRQVPVIFLKSNVIWRFFPEGSRDCQKCPILRAESQTPFRKLRLMRSLTRSRFTPPLRCAHTREEEEGGLGIVYCIMWEISVLEISKNRTPAHEARRRSKKKKTARVFLSRAKMGIIGVNCESFFYPFASWLYAKKRYAHHCPPPPAHKKDLL